MTILLSSVHKAEAMTLGSGFSARHIELSLLGGAADPIVAFDDYRMRTVTFAPHPHAGFSAVSYVFEDSSGGLRNRDSLGNDFVVGPGGIVWTQAGAGVQHDELPDEDGREVRGLQIFINLSAAAKETPPQIHRASGAEIPEEITGGGSRIRVVVGDHGASSSKVQPVEPVRLLDMAVAANDVIDVPLESGHNLVAYCVSGGARLSASGTMRDLGQGDYLAASAPERNGVLQIASPSGAQLVLLSGKALNEPVVQYGPFIMTSGAQVRAAAARYQSGAMGRLEPLPH
ncbi:pirin family protein [Croceicoccus mobilis]|uniref:Pirin n=1 Tax=Croceicoccus mobilis TaxID=1703339 RepID=A0A917DVG3_9SPHN|nr:pirin-like C-terminal cupin domain-containing protein [Croceicoccus mobilis]GGD74906.1 hypothetical protein GCM10010990_25680 [Croceicoccus mobilis]